MTLTKPFKVGILSFMALCAMVMLTAVPSWATDEDATNEVTAMQTEHKWFYWPGWAFVGLVVIVLCIAGFFWYKSAIAPKYRANKSE